MKRSDLHQPLLAPTCYRTASDDSSPISPRVQTSTDNSQSLCAIHVEDVSYHYPSRPEVTVLSHINLSIAPGRITVFIGRSGAGKSTLAALLCGLLTPTEGQISYGMQLLSTNKNQTPRSARSSSPLALEAEGSSSGRGNFFYPLCGAVEQAGGALFTGTIYDNIAYGKADATPEEVEAAARAAHAHDFISTFPAGYQTVVAGGGGGGAISMLSGGQKARIALARALVRQPHYLVLDEPTSSLDRASEQELLQPLRALRGQATVVLFTHSEMLQQLADRLYEVEEGAVRELPLPR